MTVKTLVKSEEERRIMPLHQAKYLAKDLLEAKGCHPKASRLFSESMDKLITCVDQGHFKEIENIFQSYEMRVMEFTNFIFDDQKQRNYFGPLLVNNFYECLEHVEVE